MRVGNYARLGLLPLQDHRDIAPEHRVAVRAGRIENRDEFGRFIIEGHEGSESAVMTFGDLIGGFHWAQKDTSKRQMGAWLFAAPALSTSASKKQKGTRTKDDVREIKVGLIGNDRWKLDDRFSDVVVTLPPNSPDVAKSTPMIILASTKENEQQLLGFPIDTGRLIAVNNAGDPDAASVVYDLDANSEPDETRKAKLHSFWRVIQATPEEGALAWQLTTGQQDGIAGYGYVVDIGGEATSGPKPTEPEEVPEQGESKEGQIGAVTLVSDYLKQLQDRIRSRNSTTPDQYDGSGSVTRDPVTSETKPPKDNPNPPDDGAPVVSSLVVASTTARQGGFIEVGEEKDIHVIGRTVDGLPINAAHIHCAALFKNEVGDGPLDFEVQEYEEPTVGSPFLSPVHLRWDEATPHEWAKGTAPGKWRWTAESFFYVPEDRRTTNPKTSVPPPLTDGPPLTNPPPKDCQTTPGGTRERGGRVGLAGSGGYGAPASVNNAPPSGGIFANTGADTWMPPVSYPEGHETTTEGSPTDSSQEGPGAPWPSSGQPVPGETPEGPKEPSRPRQKAGGGSVSGGAEGYGRVGRGSLAGGH